MVGDTSYFGKAVIRELLVLVCLLLREVSHLRRRRDLHISYTDRQITQFLFQQWRLENYKFGFRIVDFLFIFDHPHSNIRNTHV